MQASNLFWFHHVGPLQHGHSKHHTRLVALRGLEQVLAVAAGDAQARQAPVSLPVHGRLGECRFSRAKFLFFLLNSHTERELDPCIPFEPLPCISGPLTGSNTQVRSRTLKPLSFMRKLVLNPSLVFDLCEKA